MKTKKDLKASHIKFLSEFKLYNDLESGKLIIFDFRKKEQFNLGCLYDYSINLPFDEIGEEVLDNPKIIDEKLLAGYAHSEFLEHRAIKCKRFFIVIIISEEKIYKEAIFKSLSELDIIKDGNIVKPLKLYKNFMLNNKVREIGLYNRGFDLIRCKFPFIIHSNNLIPPKLFKNINNFHGFPSNLLKGRIYVGDQEHACSEQVIRELGITHIINTTQHVPNKHQHFVKYLKIQIEDTSIFKITPFFKDVFNFIESAFMEDENDISELSIGSGLNGLKLSDSNSKKSNNSNKSLKELDMSQIELLNLQEKFDELETFIERFDNLLQKEFNKFISKFKNNNKILIHCSLGVSRSASFTILYIMKKFGLTYDSALLLSKYHREQSCPITTFAFELEEFEKRNYSFV